MPAKQLTFLSLFAGIPAGGIDLGLERAGMRCIGQVECALYCRAVLAKHWPDVPRFDDVRKFGRESIDGPVQLICGGAPCQPHSVAGKRLGQSDSRHLWPEFARIVGEFRPSWIIFENVPGIRSTAADEVLGDLEALGYAAWPVVVGAWAVGAPHKRDRVWIVAHSESSVQRSVAGSTRGIEATSEVETRVGTLREWVRSSDDGRFANTGSRALGHADSLAQRESSDGRECPEPRQNARAGAGESGTRLLADADRDGLPGFNDRNSGRIQGAQYSKKSSEPEFERSTEKPAISDSLAYAERGGRDTRRGDSRHEESARGGRCEPAGSGSMAYSARGGFGTDGSARREAGHVDERGAGVGQADTREPGLAGRRELPSGTDEEVALSAGGSGTQWPSRPGESQHEWEAPRIVEFPVGGELDGIPVRLVRAANRNALKSFGNAVVPANAQLIGQFIVAHSEVPA